MTAAQPLTVGEIRHVKLRLIQIGLELAEPPDSVRCGRGTAASASTRARTRGARAAIAGGGAVRARLLRKIVFGGSGWCGWDKNDRNLRCDRFELSLLRRFIIAFEVCWHGEGRALLHVAVPHIQCFLKLPWTPTVESPWGDWPTWGFTFYPDTWHFHWGLRRKIITTPWRDSRLIETVVLDSFEHSFWDADSAATINGKVRAERMDRFRRWWFPRRFSTYSAWVELESEAGPKKGSWKGGTGGFGARLTEHESKHRSCVIIAVEKRMAEVSRR